MKLYDMHTHSIHSPDGRSPMEAMFESAVQKGLCGICITDHADVDENHKTEKPLETVKESLENFLQIKERFSGQITLLFGVELGQALQDEALVSQIFGHEQLDFILSSIHNICGYEDFFFYDFADKTQTEQMIWQYMDELEKTIMHSDFDSLAHLTYPFRYLRRKAKFELDEKIFDAGFDRVLKVLAQSERALEINASGLRQGYIGTHPPFAYIKRFKEFGGRLITIGSDAHRPEDVGSGLKEAVELAEAAGFKQVAYYKNRKPVLVDL